MLSERSLILSSFLFILFSLFFNAAVISTILSSSSLIHSLSSVILLLIPYSIFFHFIYFTVHLHFFFVSSRSLINVSYIFLISASIFFSSKILNHLSCHCSEFFFQIDCLFPLDLVLVGFYLALLSVTYFSVDSFCLTYRVCGLFSTGCRIVVPLASGIFPRLPPTPVDEVGPEACAASPLIGGLTDVVTRACPGY